MSSWDRNVTSDKFSGFNTSRYQNLLLLKHMYYSQIKTFIWVKVRNWGRCTIHSVSHSVHRRRFFGGRNKLHLCKCRCRCLSHNNCEKCTICFPSGSATTVNSILLLCVPFITSTKLHWLWFYFYANSSSANNNPAQKKKRIRRNEKTIYEQTRNMRLRCDIRK